MATFKGIIVMVTLCIAHAAAAAASFNATSQNSTQTYNFPYLKFISACEKRMTNECADEIVSEVLQIREASDSCCQKLVYMGKDCHDEFIRRLILLTEFDNQERKILSRNAHTWKRCSAAVSRFAPPPASAIDDTPRFPSIEDLPRNWDNLKKCVRKTTERCARQILDGIVKDIRLTRECCAKLVFMGQGCHKSLTKEFMRATKTSKSSVAKQIKSKSSKVWTECVKVVPKAST